MNVFCIGKLSYDIICPVEGALKAGENISSPERIDSAGGKVSNAAYLLGKWGQKVQFAGVTGSDDFGAKIKKEFDSVQVDTSFIETSYEKPTIVTLNIVDKTSGISTSVETYKSDFASLRKRDFGIAPEVILVEPHDYNAVHETLEKNQKATSILFASKSTPEAIDLCKFSKYLVCSSAFAETLTKSAIDLRNPSVIASSYQALKNRFPNCEIVVILKEGGALYSNNGEIKVMPGTNTKVVDKTAMEEAFLGAFTYGFANNFDIEKAVTYGLITAGLTGTKIGSRTAFPSLNEVISYYSDKFGASGNLSTSQSNGSAGNFERASQNTKTTTPEVLNSTPVSTPSNTVASPTSSAPSNPANNHGALNAIPDVMPEIPKN